MLFGCFIQIAKLQNSLLVTRTSKPNQMPRQKTLNLLKSHVPFNQEEARMTQETIAFVEANPNCFERTLEIGHVTGSAWILDKTKTFTLLTHHRKLDKWFQLGGHCDGDSNVLNVALKEAQEESGLTEISILSEAVFDVDVHLIPENKGVLAHYHYDIRFLFEADKSQSVTISEESKNLNWIKLEEVKSYNNSDSILRMVDKSSEIRVMSVNVYQVESK